MFWVAGSRPGRRVTFRSGKVTKTIEAPSCHIGWDGRKIKSGPTRRAQTGSAKYEERPSLGPAGRRQSRGKDSQRMSRQRTQAIKLNYHPDTDSLSIDLAKHPGVESREVSEGIVLDYDVKGHFWVSTSTMLAVRWS